MILTLLLFIASISLIDAFNIVGIASSTAFYVKTSVIAQIESTKTVNLITLANQLLYQAKREGKDSMIFKAF